MKDFDSFMKDAQFKLDKKMNKFDTAYRKALRESDRDEAFKSMNTALATSRDILAIKRFFNSLGEDMYVAEDEMGKKFAELLRLSRDFDGGSSVYEPALMRGYGCL